MEQEYRIDAELQRIMPELSNEDYKQLEDSLLTDGFKGAPIVVWKQEKIIVDGHNRYSICKKHNIPFEIQELEFSSRDEVIQWMVRAQLGRRNLSPLQKIEIAEHFRPLFKKKAKDNQVKAGGDRKSETYKKSVTENLPQAKKEKKRNPTVNKELSEIAGVSEKTYSMGKKILDSDNEELKQQVLTKEKSISGAYKELTLGQKSIPDENVGIVDSVEVETKSVENETINVLSEIQKRYSNYLELFQQDIKWLMTMEFYQNDEDVTGKVCSDLQNCLEKFKSISDIMCKMKIDEFGSIAINK